ncbi:hypothetical protein WJX84_005067 [Apatococcus fuscideae]|uniref:Selenoprotein W n=1 Tax=Apatococcus fuscideae TaxID=2026836 RepID=A0AAW1SWM2_9CHLO
MQGGLCGPPRRGQRWVTWCKQNNRSPAPATIPPRFAFRELAAETVVLLHYCDSCGYRPWAKQFSANLKPQLPKGTVIQELSTGNIGAFEVFLCIGQQQHNIWSKLLTGQPYSSEAIPAIVQVVAAELKDIS